MPLKFKINDSERDWQELVGDRPPLKREDLDAYRGSVATFNHLGELIQAAQAKIAELDERIERGIEYCRANPRDVNGPGWLRKLRQERAEADRELNDLGGRLGIEADLQHEMTRRMVGPGRHICHQCWRVFGPTGVCECLKP